MANQTIVTKDSTYRSHLDALESGNQRASGEDHHRARAVNAAVELLHAAALGGAFSDRGGNTGNAIGEAIGPLADAIEAALKSSPRT